MTEHVDRPAEAVTVRPGETLVLRYDRPLSPKQAAAIRERLKALLPDIDFVLVEADQLGKITAETLAEAVRLSMENPGRTVEISDQA